MLNNNNIKYKNKLQFIKYKDLKYNLTKKKVTLDAFKARFMTDFYSASHRRFLKKFLNISETELNYSLSNQYVLAKYFKKKYYSFFKKKIKTVTRRYFKRYRTHFKKKKRKKKINLRFKFFFRINYDNFLFYLTLLNKQFIVKPFNFLNCLFFFKTKIFKKHYLIRRRRRRTKLYYKLLRIRGKRYLRRRRMRHIRYRLKKKILFKRFKIQRFKKFKSFFRVIAFMKFCKKNTVSVDDNFKIKSSSRLRYKFLKFNFNKINNSYEFFMHLKKRKQKIKLFMPKNNFIKQKIKLSNIPIKFKLKNRWINKNINNNINKKKLHLLIFSNNKNFSELTFSPKLIKSNEFIKSKNNNNFLNEYLIREANYSTTIAFPDYLILTNSIKNAIINNYYSNTIREKKNIKKSYKLIFIIKLINKLSKKILFFEKKINNIKLKQKKKTLRLSLKLLIINKKIVKKFKKLKKTIQKLLYIINKLKNKLKELILNFYILFFTNNEKINNLKNNDFLKKIYYFLKKKSYKKYNILKKRKHLFSFLFLNFHRRAILGKNKRFIFGYINKLNNRYFEFMPKNKRWMMKRIIRKKLKKKKKAFLRRVKKHWNLSKFSFYKTYINNTPILTNNFYSFLFFKKFKLKYLNFLKNKNILYFKNIQKNKNIEFLK